MFEMIGDTSDLEKEYNDSNPSIDNYNSTPGGERDIDSTPDDGKAEDDTQTQVK